MVTYAACQALEFHRPLRTTEPLEAMYALVREKVAPWDRDRHMTPDIEACVRTLYPVNQVVPEA